MNPIIEPGVLKIFRLFVAAQVGFNLLVGYIKTNYPVSFPDEFHYRESISILASVILLVYLSLPWIHRKLKSWYLPIALFFVTVNPLISNSLYLLMQAPGEPTNLIFSAYQLIPGLFIPLVLIAWQYTLPVLALFCLGTGIYDISSAIMIANNLQLQVIPILGVVVIRTVSFLVVGYMVNELVKTQRQQRKALTEANLKLSLYANTVEQLATSRERNRLARELHDTLAHTLSGLAVQLEAIKTVVQPGNGEVFDMIDQACQTTRNGLTETRRALKDLRATQLDDLGLKLALYNLAISASSRNNISLDFHFDDSIGNLPPQIEQTIFRITQEAFENILRHSAASRVQLGLTRLGNHLELTVKDNGIGFINLDQNSSQGLGILGMKERAEMAGGLLEVSSHPQEGTKISFKLETPDD
jgi:signal transduction histidine kinase